MKNMTYLLELFSDLEYVCHENLVFLEGKGAIVINKEPGGCLLALCSVLGKSELYRLKGRVRFLG